MDLKVYETAFLVNPGAAPTAQNEEGPRKGPLGAAPYFLGAGAFTSGWFWFWTG